MATTALSNNLNELDILLQVRKRETKRNFQNELVEPKLINPEGDTRKVQGISINPNLVNPRILLG